MKITILVDKNTLCKIQNNTSIYIVNLVSLSSCQLYTKHNNTKESIWYM